MLRRGRGRPARFVASLLHEPTRASLRAGFRACVRAGLCATLLAPLVWVSTVQAAPLEIADRAAADGLAATPPSAARDKALERWARRRASLAEIAYVLRRPPSELAGSEAPLVAAALEKASADRTALRRRLLARLALVAGDRARPGPKRGETAGAPVLYPRASVFTVAALLPDSGDYQDYGRAVLAGLRAGLEADSGSALPAIEVVLAPTGQDDPRAALEAFELVAPRAGSIVGELLSVPTLVLAAAARFGSLPLISPTATDEEIGAMGGSVFQIGPSAHERGSRLAGAMLSQAPPRVGVLVSNAGSSIVEGFTTAARNAGAPVVYEDRYAAGTSNFRDQVKALVANQVDLLFWDGEAREGEALVRQLARDRVSLRLCGGDRFAPEQHHSETRVLLEGVRYVGDEWQANDSLSERLATLLDSNADERAAHLALRGFLAGRVLREAIASGALCPEEIAGYLATRVSKEPHLKARGFLDLEGQGVSIPVHSVQRGKSVLQSNAAP